MKKLFGFLTFIILGINFGYCVDLPVNDTFNEYDGYYGYNMETAQAGSQSNPTQVNLSSSYDFVCMRHDSNTLLYFSFDRSTWNGVGVNSFTCVPSGRTIYLYGDTTARIYFFKQGLGIVPILSSQECQLEYSLIPISEVNSEYCQTNNLCPSSGTGDCNYGSGENWSALYINNLQFPGKSNIFVTIPDYIYWDYSSDDSDFNLYVGSGYDVEYIEKIIDINSYQPSSDDFTEIFVGGLTWIMPYIVIALFIVFVRKLLKRIFR